MYTETRNIEEFLNEYSRSRVVIISTVRATLNRALGFEQKFSKPFYEFNTDEILEMYKSSHTISDRTLQNTNLTLKHAARWIINKNSLALAKYVAKLTNHALKETTNNSRIIYSRKFK